MTITVSLTLAHHNKNRMIHITPFFFPSTVVLDPLDDKRIFKASFHPLFNVLVVAEFVVSALTASV